MIQRYLGRIGGYCAWVEAYRVVDAAVLVVDALPGDLRAEFAAGDKELSVTPAGSPTYPGLKAAGWRKLWREGKIAVPELERPAKTRA